MHPIVLAYATGIDYMGEVIFAIGEDKVSVRHCVVATRRSGFCGHRNSRGPLDRFYGPFGSGEAGETPIKEILQMVAKNKWKAPASIELEYQIPEGSDAVKETRKCVEFCRNALTGSSPTTASR